MKYFMTLFCMIIAMITTNVFAQEYTLSHSGGKLILKGVDNATITGYDGSEIKFTGNFDVDDEARERSAGLMAINSLGLEDNTGYGISVVKDGENVVVSQVNNLLSESEDGILIQLPSSMGIDYSHSTYNSQSLKISNVTKEIVVSTNYTHVKLENVTGPMSIKTVYGSIEASFASLNQSSSVSLNSVYEFVDVAIPSASKANLDMKTPYGQIYSDMDIAVKTSEDGMKEISQKKLTGTINGGGVDLILKSGYENIYLRKK